MLLDPPYSSSFPCWAGLGELRSLISKQGEGQSIGTKPNATCSRFSFQ